MTKAEVVTEIAKRTGVDKGDILATMEAFFEVVKTKMSEGENIYVRGFGSFVNKKRAGKIGRNISKNVAVRIEEHYVPTFKPAKIFLESVRHSEKVKLANQ